MIVYGHVLETLLLVGLALFVTACGVSFDKIWMSDVPNLTMKTLILAMRCPKCGASKIWRSRV